MKIEIGQITHVSGSDFDIEFCMPTGCSTPVGTKIVMERDEPPNTHQCKEIKESKIQLFHSSRFGWGLSLSDSKFIEHIWFCPGCGMKLED